LRGRQRRFRRLGADTRRRQQPPVRSRHQRQGRPGLLLQALHGAGGLGLRQPQQDRDDRRRRLLHQDGYRQPRQVLDVLSSAPPEPDGGGGPFQLLQDR